MYSVKLGYDVAIGRIKKLLENRHSAEALVTSMFTVEKTLRRTLRQLIVSTGFASKYADKIVKRLKGLEAIKESWELYDPDHKQLTTIISDSDWKIFKDASEMRNKMIHGERVYELETCKTKAGEVLSALNRLKNCFDNKYGYSGWSRGAVRRKSNLHADSKVEKISP